MISQKKLLLLANSTTKAEVLRTALKIKIEILEEVQTILEEISAIKIEIQETVSAIKEGLNQEDVMILNRMIETILDLEEILMIINLVRGALSDHLKVETLTEKADHLDLVQISMVKGEIDLLEEMMKDLIDSVATTSQEVLSEEKESSEKIE